MRLLLANPRPSRNSNSYFPGTRPPARDSSRTASRWRRGLAKAWRLLADSTPPTLGGWLVAVLCALGLWRWGFGSLDLVVFVFSVSGLVLFVLSTLAIGGSALWLRRRTGSARRTRQVLEAGTPLDTGFELPALAKVPLVKVEWRWERPSGVDCRQILTDDGRLREVAVARRRCKEPTVQRRLTVRCAFGLSRVSWLASEPAELTVLPEVGKLGSMEVLQSIASSEGLPHPSGAPEGDRMEIRRYVPGDSVRHILWKTYARTRTLNVRTPERAIDRSERTVAYLLASPGDEPAAAAARVALERGLLGETWIFGCDGVAESAERVDAALDHIARSGSWRPAPGTDPASGLVRFLESPEVFGERHVVVFASARPSGPLPAWTEPVLAALGRLGVGADFVLGTDGVVRRGPVPLWQRLLFAPADEGEAVSHHDLDRLLGHLDRSGYGALLVDRTSGRKHGGKRGGPNGGVRRRALAS